MDCIVVSRMYLVTKGEGEAGIVVDSVEIVIFSMDPDWVLV